jgi:hypothetical protein
VKHRSLARLLNDEENLKRTLAFLATRPYDGQRRQNAEARLRSIQRAIADNLQLPLIPRA